MSQTEKQKRQKAGQIFSIDVLFSLLPILMILGASLQYLYLVEERSKEIAQGSSLEMHAQAISEYVMAEFKSSGNFSGPYSPFVRTDDCAYIKTSLSNAAGLLPTGYVYHARAEDYYNYASNIPAPLCATDKANNTLWPAFTNLDSSFTTGKNAIEYINNTAASDTRFMVLFDSTGKMLPGQIGGVSFSVWKNIK